MYTRTEENKQKMNKTKIFIKNSYSSLILFTASIYILMHLCGENRNVHGLFSGKKRKRDVAESATHKTILKKNVRYVDTVPIPIRAENNQWSYVQCLSYTFILWRSEHDVFWWAYVVGNFREITSQTRQYFQKKGREIDLWHTHRRT